MAILEINLEKPALIEEYQFPTDSSARTTQSEVRERSETGQQSDDDSDESESSGGLKGKLLGLLVVAAGVGLAVWKFKNRGGSEQTDFDEFETEAEFDADEGTEVEFETDGGGKKKTAGVVGLAVAVVGLVAAVQKRRN
ncbi:hypothetical protein [Halorussus pelagicus]|uniref:hypothetical protein n=1 Tax=Halorussus pelagicus TaxID=2505977 RepID=UPI000FFB92A5|nr:hypothetical protein [Halorussus pelagicus]